MISVLPRQECELNWLCLDGIFPSALSVPPSGSPGVPYEEARRFPVFSEVRKNFFLEFLKQFLHTKDKAACAGIACISFHIPFHSCILCPVVQVNPTASMSTFSCSFFPGFSGVLGSSHNWVTEVNFVCLNWMLPFCQLT